jgi:hypothetical protein
MNLNTNQKQEIQCFVYFLFKGTLDQRLISADYHYLDKVLKKPDLLYNCFEIFAFAAQTSGLSGNFLISPKKHEGEEKKYVWGMNHRFVADYIIQIHKGSTTNESAKSKMEQAKEFNKKHNNIWKDFLVLSKWFCYNSFPNPVNENYVSGLNGVGTDAVPVFAVWTNIVEVDENLNVLNSDFALRRANERIKLWDKEQPKQEFKEWELEQVIY